MKIYHYHPETKEYLGEDTADESPLEPGVFLIPAHATQTRPPETTQGQIPVFDYNHNSWSLIQDKRGKYYSVIDGSEINNNNPLVEPENSTLLPPPEIPQGKLLKWDLINSSWNLEDIPVLTPEEKLQQAGLTVNDLKKLLGLSS